AVRFYGGEQKGTGFRGSGRSQGTCQEAASIRDQNEERAAGIGEPHRSQTASCAVKNPHQGQATWPAVAVSPLSPASIQSGGRSIIVPVPGTGMADQSSPVWKKSVFPCFTPPASPRASPSTSAA